MVGSTFVIGRLMRYRSQQDTIIILLIFIFHHVGQESLTRLVKLDSRLNCLNKNATLGELCTFLAFASFDQLPSQPVKKEMRRGLSLLSPGSIRHFLKTPPAP